jgi:hypothetical protein
MSSTTEKDETSGLFSNICTRPTFDATYQRLASPGGCTIAMGCEEIKAESLNVRFGNAGSVPIVTLPVERVGAMHVLLLGRASRPLVVAGGDGGGSGAGGSGDGGTGVTGGAGLAGGAGGGVFCSPSLPLSQPTINKTKDNMIPVVCLD